MVQVHPLNKESSSSTQVLNGFNFPLFPWVRPLWRWGGILCVFLFSFSVYANPTDSIEITDIVLECHYKTKSRIITREMAIQVGDIIARDNIVKLFEKEKNKLMNTDLFISVKLYLHEYEPGKAEVIVSLSEKWYFYPAPIFELADRNFSVWWTQQNRSLSRLEYGVRMRYKNFRGRKEDLKFLLQFGFTKKFELTYGIPFINRSQTLGMNFKFLYTENKSAAFNTINNQQEFFKSEENQLKRLEFSNSIVHRANFYTSHRLSYGYARKDVSDSIRELNPLYFLHDGLRQEYLQMSYTFTHDKRDFNPYPLKGLYFQGQIQKLGMGIFKEVNQWEAQGRFYRFFKLSSHWFAATSFSAKLSGPSLQAYANRSGLGFGSEVMRGYELFVIETQHHALTKNTLRFKLFETVKKVDHFLKVEQFNKIPIAAYLKVYLDAAYVHNPMVQVSNASLNNRMLYGAGIGLDVVTYYNIVGRFEYSTNFMGQPNFFFNLKSEY